MSPLDLIVKDVATEGHVLSLRDGQRTDEAMSHEEKTVAAKSVVRHHNTSNTSAARALAITGKSVCLHKDRPPPVIVEKN